MAEEGGEGVSKTDINHHSTPENQDRAVAQEGKAKHTKDEIEEFIKQERSDPAVKHK